MIKNALWKDIFRDIKKSKGRFISIASIIALGVMLFTGVKSAPLDMKSTADKYYDDYNLMDFKILSTLGLTENDVKDIRNIDGVLGVESSNTMDVISKVNSDEFVTRIHSLPDGDLTSNNEDYINRLNIIEGRLPEKQGECVVANENFKSLNLKIGDKISVRSGTNSDILESLKSSEYEVVGIVETPYYLTDQIGSSNIGSGSVSTFMFVKQSDFKSDIFTEIYVTVDGAKAFNSYNDNYFDVIDEVSSSIENISSIINTRRYDEIKYAASEELSKGKQEYEDKKSEVEAKLKDAETTIENSRNDLITGETELKNKEIELNNSIANGEYQISSAENELSQKEAEYNEGLAVFNEAKSIAEEGFKQAETGIQDAENKLVELQGQASILESMLASEDISEEEKVTIQMQLDDLNIGVNELNNKINEAKTELQNKKEELASQEQVLKDAKVKLDDGKSTLAYSKSTLEYTKNNAYDQIEKAKEEIAKGKEELAKGESEYEENKKIAEEELSKAEGKIKDAENEISKIENAELYILDRNSHYSYVDYENSANSIDKLSNVFPVFFFIVAALVCLTTMTRMVDEQRVNIGTMKALGYDKGSIAKKFIVYALLASLIGCIVGATLGFTILPLVIFDAYNILYILPRMSVVVNIPLLITVFIVAIGVTTLATYAACRIELIETPSVLMRPKAPKEGKRILLERIPFIWNRFNFIGKVTIRNIFRYKKRFLMTVIGIAGSTALLLAGFGIKDSIKTVVSKQYGELTKYEIMINLDNTINIEEKNNIENYLNGEENIKDYLFVRSESSNVKSKDTNKDITIIIPSELDKFDDFEHLQERKTSNTVNLPSNGIAITEKLAKSLGVKVGDEVKITNSNDLQGVAKVGAIVEHYINHYIYMDPTYYENIFNEIVEVNGTFVKLDNEEKVNNISNTLIDIDGVAGVVNNTSIKENFDDTIKSLDLVVLVMIFCAGTLSFIVLYNLTNVNISERIREIATIKVLGFYDKEVSSYIFRENILLTVIGVFGGLLLGTVFHQFIMVTVEMDYVMFGRSIDVRSYIMATILTIIFSLLVNWTMYFKLKKVEMVESLKSVD